MQEKELEKKVKTEKSTNKVYINYIFVLDGSEY